jgi:hypothetical protein
MQWGAILHGTSDRAYEKLECEKAKLERELLVARKLIELAGKAHEILGGALLSLEDGEKLPHA